jgi:hypothetical protein
LQQLDPIVLSLAFSGTTLIKENIGLLVKKEEMASEAFEHRPRIRDHRERGTFGDLRILTLQAITRNSLAFSNVVICSIA